MEIHPKSKMLANSVKNGKSAEICFCYPLHARFDKVAVKLLPRCNEVATKLDLFKITCASSASLHPSIRRWRFAPSPPRWQAAFDGTPPFVDCFMHGLVEADEASDVTETWLGARISWLGCVTLSG